jgi:hypothetical protein
MYGAVPSTTPGVVWTAVAVGASGALSMGASLVIARARPKSSTLTVPSGRTLTLAGFRSR